MEHLHNRIGITCCVVLIFGSCIFFAATCPAQPPGAVPTTGAPGAINPRTGEVYPKVPGGVLNPRTGEIYPQTQSGGALNPRTGEVYPSAGVPQASPGPAPQPVPVPSPSAQPSLPPMPVPQAPVGMGK
ncbi:MAG TPA: hypothetical protein VMT71_06580 [Syntrophorhabdales bacterium]|nr:hypothetical protein [Syntrophorhabdales bacterium]